MAEIKIPRYVTEYARSEQKKRIDLLKKNKGNPDFPTKDIEEQVNKIARLVLYCQKGMITVSETMEKIATLKI